MVDKIEKLRAEAKRLQAEADRLEKDRGKALADYENRLAQSVVDDGTKAPAPDTMEKYDEKVTSLREKADVMLRAAAEPLRELGDVVLDHQGELIKENRVAAADTLGEVTTHLDDLDDSVATLGERMALFHWATRLRSDKVDRATGVGAELREVVQALEQVRRALGKVADEVTPVREREIVDA